jgi:hypothetical protein
MNKFLSHLSCQQIVSLSQPSCVSPVELTDRERGEEWAWRQIKRPRESLAFYKSFHILCLSPPVLAFITGAPVAAPSHSYTFSVGHLLGRAVLLAPVGPLCGSCGAPNMYDHRGRRRREWTQHGVLCCLAGLGRGADL